MIRRIKGLWKLLFGRTTILVLLLAVQIVAISVGFEILGNNVIAANYIGGILAAIILMYLVNNNQNSSFKLMWIILILTVPILGVAFYFYTKFQPLTRKMAVNLDRVIKSQHQYLMPDRDCVDKLLTENSNEFGVFKFIYEEGHYPVYDDASVRYFPSGEDKFKELVFRLERAKEFIFLEYFIIEQGYMWDTIYGILKKKAAEGVEVRVLYDGTCNLTLLPRNFPKKVRADGIKCRIFSPMRPFLSTHQNNRDHRKVVVVDGEVAFTGGINLADEYINRRKRFGHWKDTGLMVKGEAVRSFTMMFLQNWNISTGQKEDYSRYIRHNFVTEQSLRNGGYIAPYGDNPLNNEEVGKKVYLDILNRANRYVHIMTPYLILDEETKDALMFAAQRGIDVKLIMPHIPDKKYAYFLARTYYEELIRGGVKIYEYTPGFVHAKVFTSDDEKAVVGTINLDYRSLYLHFECAAYMYRNPIVNDIEMDFSNTLSQCQRITLEDCASYNLLFKICGRALKLVAPLM